jgi:hypothetical protein
MLREYVVIETDAGLTVRELVPGTSPEEVAEREGGLVADPGPYKSFDDAYDAILALKEEEAEEEENAS